MFTQVTTPTEVAETAIHLQDINTVNGVFTREAQVWLLASLLNGGLDVLRAFGGSAMVTVDAYSKQTKAKPRVEGRDFARLAGVRSNAHVGQVTKAWRTQEGHLVLRLFDHNRQPTPEALERARFEGKNPPQPFTCVRVSGIRSIVPGVPFGGPKNA